MTDKRGRGSGSSNTSPRQPAPAVTPPPKEVEVPLTPVEEKSLTTWLQQTESQLKGLLSGAAISALTTRISSLSTPPSPTPPPTGASASGTNVLIRNAENMFIIKTALPSTTAIILKRCTYDTSTYQLVKQYIQSILLLFSRSIDEDVVELWRLGTMVMDPTFAAWGSQLPFSEDVINYFHRQRGFEKLVLRVASSHKRPISLGLLASCVRLFAQVKLELKASMFTNWVDQIHTPALDRMKSLTADEIRMESKTTVSAIVEDLTSILKQGNFKIGDSMDILFLNVADKFFKCQYLEKRLAGLSDIKDMALKCRQRDQYMKFRSYIQQQNPQGINISTDAFMKWLKENKTVETLFGPTIHIELLHRCADILRLMAEEQKMSKDQIDLIWSASTGAHATVLSTVLQVLLEITSYLSNTLSEHIIPHLKALPFPSFTSQHCNLLYNLCIFHLDDLKVTNQAIEILWDMVQDHTASSPELANDGLLSLTKIISHIQEKQKTVKLQYLEKCIKNLQAHKSVPQSLHLIQKLTESPSQVRKVNPQTKEQIKFLVTKHNLFNLVLQDLKFWKDRSAEVSASAPSGLMPGTKKTLHQHLRSRLNFLQYAFSNSDYEMDKPVIELIWDSLIVKASGPDKDLPFEWLESVLSTQQELHSFADGIPEFIFLDKFSQLDFTFLSERAFRTFKFFFLNINTAKQKIENKPPPPTPITNCSCSACLAAATATTSTNPTWLVKSLDLLGLDMLWRVILESTKPEVTTLGSNLLLGIQENLAPALKPQLLAIRESFTSRCMEILTTSSQAIISDGAANRRQEAQNTVHKALLLIKAFVDKFEIKSSKIQRHSTRARGNVVDISIETPSGKEAEFQAYHNDTLASLKEKIANKLGWAPAAVVIRTSSKSKEIVGDDCTLESIGIRSGRYLAARRTKVSENFLPKPYEITKEEEVLQPTTLLASEKYFSHLIKLLSAVTDESTGNVLWELLNFLPTNESILNQLQSITGIPTPNWGDLLESRSLYKLLYSLVIVESFLDPSSNAQVEEERKAWRHAFLCTGGVAHLLRLLLHTDFTEKSLGSRKIACLCKLLRISKYYLIGETGHIKADVLTPEIGISDIADKCLGIVSDANASSPDVEADSNIDSINLSMELFVSCSLSQPRILHQTLEKKGFNEWLAASLLHSSRSAARRAVYMGFKKLCTSFEAISEELPRLPHGVMLQKLLSFLSAIGHNCSTADYYFRFLTNLIIDSCAGKDGGSASNFKELLPELVELIKQHNTLETRIDPVPDTVLCGLFEVVRAIVKDNKHLKVLAGQKNGLVQELFHRCLFDIPSKTDHAVLAPPKCKTKHSRIVAYDLLEELCHTCPRNYSEVISLVLEHHTSTEITLPLSSMSWSYSPHDNSRSECGYVGLKNLGATCYMNSLLQQLYMHPEFRTRILLATPPKDGTGQSTESVLYQMQCLFSALQESEKRYLDTRAFCSSIKRGGAPVNTQVQMDAEEFLIQLFDSLEMELTAGGNSDNFIKSLFGGTVCQQVISQECEHVSSQLQGFFTLSLELKGKKTLEESLAHYIEGDTLTGDNKYSCERCAAKVSAIKRTTISQLPPSLVIHNKRFDFDYQEMRRIKVNDHHFFPSRLNLEPYTLEAVQRRERKEKMKDTTPDVIDASPYEYELVGILVHNGTADSGHYYSYIKERQLQSNQAPSSETPPDPNSGVWFHFNDGLVESFDPREIPSQCYGGTDNIEEYDAQLQNYISRTLPKSYSAYMLFYNKVNAESVASPSAQPSVIPPEIFDSLWEENSIFLTEKNLFDSDYGKFVVALLQYSDKSEHDITQVIQLGSHYLLNVLSHYRDRGKKTVKQCTDLLISLYSKSIPACHWLLEYLIENKARHQHIILECSHQDIGASVESIIMSAIKTLQPTQLPIFNSYTPADENSAVQEVQNPLKPRLIGTPQSITVRYMESLLEMFGDLASYWKSFHWYFTLFSDFAQLGEVEVGYILSRRIAGLFGDFFLGDDSPLVRFHTNKSPKMGDKQYIPDFDQLLAFCCHVVVAVHKSKGTLVMSAEENEIFSSVKFYTRAMLESANPKQLATTLAVLCENNENFTSAILLEIRTSIKRIDSDELSSFFVVLGSILSVGDSLQQLRLSTICEFIFGSIDEGSPSSTIACLLQFLTETALSLPVMRPLIWEWRKLIVNQCVTSYQEACREFASKLLQCCCLGSGAVPSSKTIQIPAASCDNSLLDALMEELVIMFDTAQKCTDRILASIGTGSNRSDRHVWRLVPYLQLVLWTLHTPSQFAVFANHTEAFYQLLFRIDSTHQDQDENRMEMNKIWWECIQKCPAFVKQTVSKEDYCKRFMEFFVSLSPARSQIQYNNETSPYYYKVLLVCSKENHDFLKYIIFHSNFDWAIDHLLLECQEYPEIAEVLLQFLDYTCKTSTDFRAKYIPIVATSRHLVGNPVPVLRLTLLLMQTEQDKIAFCLGKGESSSGLVHIQHHIQPPTGNLETFSLFVKVLANSVQWIETCERTVPPPSSLAKSRGSFFRHFTPTITALCSILNTAIKDLHTFTMPDNLTSLLPSCYSFIMLFCRSSKECLEEMYMTVKKTVPAMLSTLPPPAGAQPIAPVGSKQLYYRYITELVMHAISGMKSFGVEMIEALDILMCIGAHHFPGATQACTTLIHLDDAQLKQLWADSAHTQQFFLTFLEQNPVVLVSNPTIHTLFIRLFTKIPLSVPDQTRESLGKSLIGFLCQLPPSLRPSATDLKERFTHVALAGEALNAVLSHKGCPLPLKQQAKSAISQVLTPETQALATTALSSPSSPQPSPDTLRRLTALLS
ncbi:ubiquitin hydrolase [Pelomyxa schiedti]|nr:ubiquitin hydrolase [Pelomyxa schiedti]